MTIQEIAARVAELCRKGDFESVQRELYAQDAVSTEPYSTPEFEKETRGLPAIFKKGEKFQSITEELHSVTISEPLCAENSFAFIMTMDMTMKGRERTKGVELCVYRVKEGKIISEQFFV